MNTNAAIIPTNVANLLALKGQIVTLTTTRSCKVRKGEAPIVKTSTFQCRIGINYDNMKSVQEKRADGTLPEVNAGLPWGQWVIFPYVITHNGEFYLRCTVLNGGNKTDTTFTRNGFIIDREEAKLACLASEFRDSDNDCFTVKVSGIIKVNGEAVK